MRHAILLLFATSAFAADVRELTAVPASHLTLDGAFDEPFWQGAPVSAAFLILNASATAPRQTRARLAFDRENLLLALEADDPDTGSLSTVQVPRDDPRLWQQDSLEVMLQPVPGSRTYFHLAFTPSGSRYDGMSGTSRPAAEWNPDPDWQVAVRKLPDRWQAEVVIPFKALGTETPLQGALWGLKVCRSIYARGGNRQGDYHTTWSQQPSGSFHDPMGWGRLYFADKNTLRNAAFTMPPQENGLPALWSDQLVWQNGQQPSGKLDQITLDGRNLLRLTKFAAGPDVLPRAMITSLVRGGRRFRATVSARARGEVALGLTMYAGTQSSHVSTPFRLTGDDFQTLTATCDAPPQVHAITVMVSFAPGSGGELLLRDVSLVDEGPPPLPRPALRLNHGLDAACQSLVDMKPYDLLRDESGRTLHERLIFTDEATGVEIRRITSDWSTANAIYSNMFPWNADGSAYKLSTWERPGGPFMLAEADGSALRFLPEPVPAQGYTWTHDPDWLVYGTFDTITKLNWRTGETQEVFRVPPELKHGERPYLTWDLDLPGAVYYEQAFGTEPPLYFIDLKTAQITRLPITSDSTGDKAKDWLYSAGLSHHRDGTWWVQYSLNHLPHLSEQNPYQQRVVSLDGRRGRDRLTLGQPPGKPAQPLYSHGGTQPSHRYETGYSGGGICLWDFDTWEGKVLVPGPQDGHISWEYQDDWFFAGTTGRPLTGPFTSMLLKVYTDGTWYPVAYGNTSNAGYDANFFANTSPDGTKGSFSSDMLGPVNLFWCVISYPQPPLNLRGQLRGGCAVLTWDKPQRCAENAGYNIYRSPRSGLDFEKLNAEPIQTLLFEDPSPGKTAYYVVSAVEHSGLESRCSSNEVAVGDTKAQPERLWMEAERGELQAPLRENLHGSASNQLFVDYRDGDGPATATYPFTCRRNTHHVLWGRVRYQGAGTPAEPWAITADGKPVGRLVTTSVEWEWVKLAEKLSARTNCSIGIKATGPGFALDKLLLTDDLAFTPSGEQKLDTEPPAAPTSLAITRARTFDLTLTWQPIPGADHYQVYRGATADFAIGRETLIASPSVPTCVDWGLRQGTRYFYKLTSVDAFGNESAATESTAASTVPLPQVVHLTLEAEQATLAPGQEVIADPQASGGGYVKLPAQTAGAAVTFPKLTVEFQAPVEGDYIVWLKACPVSDRGYAYASVEMDGGPARSFLVFFPERKGSTAFADNYRWVSANAMRRELPVRFHLPAGVHTLLVGSEPYHQDFGLDQLIITNDLGKRPEGRLLPWQ